MIDTKEVVLILSHGDMMSYLCITALSDQYLIICLFYISVLSVVHVSPIVLNFVIYHPLRKVTQINVNVFLSSLIFLITLLHSALPGIENGHPIMACDLHGPS